MKKIKGKTLQALYPKCDKCKTNKHVVCVIKYYEWYCTKCKSGWMGAA